MPLLITAGLGLLLLQLSTTVPTATTATLLMWTGWGVLLLGPPLVSTLIIAITTDEDSSDA